MPGIEPLSEERQSIASADEIDETLIMKEAFYEEVDLSDEELANIPERGKVYGRSVLATFSYGMVDPFLTTIAYDMGASGSQMGWLRALTNLLGNFIQPIFGFLSDTVQRRTIFVALSNILYSSIWILLLFVNRVSMIIVLASVIALVVSLGTPAWTALLGEITPTKVRGKIIANVNWFSQLPYILSTILGGILFNFIVGEVSIGSWSLPVNYILPIGIGLLAGFGSAIVIFTFKEKQAKERAQKLNALLKEKAVKQKVQLDDCIVEDKIIDNVNPQPLVKESQEVICLTDDKDPTLTKVVEKTTFKTRISEMVRNRDYVKFTLIFSIQSFFMSMCWPLFPIRQRGDIGADYLQIAIFSVIMSFATLTTVRYAGRVSDLIGRKPQMFLNRLILVAMPLGYMFASQIWHIYVIHAVICIPLGLNSAVMQAYLIDITPEKDRSTYVGIYNMIFGVTLFLGSLFGGYLIDFLMGEITFGGFTPSYDQYQAVSIAFAVGFVGRLLTSLPFLLLKDVKTFPYKLKDLPKIVFKSKRLLPLLMVVSFFFASVFLLMGIMGILP